MINYYVDIFNDVNYRDLTDFIKSLVPDRYIIHDDLVTFSLLPIDYYLSLWLRVVDYDLVLL